ncbi:MAG TPA: DUF3488 and transglutaminase-like domain-containing protein [Acidobacteriota bacterium]|nr:DUF3488 and transglutaminase-like domain-containing protein [Acidobacteriota bacterium]
MSFSRYFKFSSYCLIGSGFVAIAATGTLDLFSLILISSALIASWFLDTGQLYRRLEGWALNAMALIYLPFYLIDYKLLSRSFMISTIHTVFYVAALKLLTLAKDRDYAILYIISFAELLAASTLSIDLTFALSLTLFLFSAVSTLVLFEMRRSNAKAMEKGRLQPPVIPRDMEGSGLELFSRFPAGKVAVLSLMTTLMIVLMAIPLFFLLPRRAMSILRRPLGQTQFISGFSERVELGEIGNIKESDALVMRVRVSEPPERLPDDLKWRGIALDHYDGRAWSKSDPRRRAVILQEAGFYKVEEYSHSRPRLSETFFLEALATDVIFASRRVLAVSRDIGLVQRDSSESLYTLKHAQRKIRYVAVCEPPEPEAALLDSGPWPIPDAVGKPYLQLPPEDPRIGQLAREITRGVEGPYRKARALESYLRANYAYSLELRGSPREKDPLAAFLFDIRSGHCEYFASAMTIMLRELGIPARLVNGFRRGEYNRIGNDWAVRQYDAHSWVEAYMGAFGWYEFDPTPPDPRRLRPAFARMLEKLMDAIDLWWWEEVVSYDFYSQSELVGRLRARLSEYQYRLKMVLAAAYLEGRSGVERIQTSGWVRTQGPLFLVAAALLLVAVRVVLSRQPGLRKRLSRTLRRLISRPKESSIAASFYEEALDLLRSRGLRRARGQTPLEFAHSLGDLRAAEPFKALTSLYYQARFGPAMIGELSSKGEGLLRSLRSALHQQK